MAIYPHEIKEAGELITRPGDPLKFVKSPLTAGKVEIAGAALNHLINRVKAENMPQGENPSPQAKK